MLSALFPESVYYLDELEMKKTNRKSLQTLMTCKSLPEHEYFQELSRSRTGYSTDMDLSALPVRELEAKRLEHLGEDGVSVPLHLTVYGNAAPA